MDTHITSSYYSDYGCEATIDTRHSASNVPYAKPEVIETTIVENGDIHRESQELAKERRNKNLKAPWKKGQSGNPRGKPKGTVQIKDSLRKRFKKENANKVCDAMIKGAEEGDHKSREHLMKLTGDLDETPQVSINNNTINISEDIIEAAKEYLKNQSIKKIE